MQKAQRLAAKNGCSPSTSTRNAGSRKRTGGSDLLEQCSNSKKVKQFDPRKISFLVVDDDPQCLTSIVKMLKKFHNVVYQCSSGVEALQLLRQHDKKVDIVLVDILMPGELDGFKLLELIGIEICIPVVLMSVEGSNSNVLKGVTYGAVNFISKPVRSQDLRFLWQHAFSKIITEEKQKHEGKSKSKKPRMIWTPELHQRFVEAVTTLGIDKAVPKKIKEYMGIQFLQREHIASHLQKYRLFLKQTPNVLMPQLEAPSSIAGKEEDHLLQQQRQQQQQLIQQMPPSTASVSVEMMRMAPPTLSLPAPTLLPGLPGGGQPGDHAILPDFVVSQAQQRILPSVRGIQTNGGNVNVFADPAFGQVENVHDQSHAFFFSSQVGQRGSEGE
mmetsp:Transcript_10406/g.26023  ORF Transcript_10406/g.26023 Transcript_10406/m.26023 type:complete len:386 (+) Transcript_10406:273-1430(+)